MLPLKTPISIVIFSKKKCPPCTATKNRLNTIISLADRAYGEGVYQVQEYNVKEQPDIVGSIDVTNLPVVLFDGKIGLPSGMASELLYMSKKTTTPVGLEFEMIGNEPNSNFSSQRYDLLYNHLFSEMVKAYESKAKLMRIQEDERKLVAFSLVQNLAAHQYETKTPIREDIGDYVHIGVVQRIVLSLLALSDVAENFLHQGGRDLGRHGISQVILPLIYPDFHKGITPKEKFKEAINRLKALYNKNEFALHITDRAKIIELEKNYARLQIDGSAYATGVGDVQEPLCHLLAGEMEGIIETQLGDDVSVNETKCWGTGANHCEFEIRLGEKSKVFLPSKTSPKTLQERMYLFEERLGIISRNMNDSLRMKTSLRGMVDFVHISALQQALATLKVSDPFTSILLYFAGNRFGSLGADKYTLMKIVDHYRTKKNLRLPFEFNDGITVLAEYFRHPSIMLERSHGLVEYEITEEEKAEFRIFDSAFAVGMQVQLSKIEKGDRPDNFLKPIKKLCDFTAGFIAGRLKILTGAEPKVEETHCYSSGDNFCQFSVELE
ncbi:MAG: V4R domain-containing protein [Candidatus Hodarchaeota archaeon]